VSDVQLLVTCLVDGFFPAVGVATVELLERAGDTVHFPADQTCCGQPAFNVGARSEAARMAGHTLDVLDATDGPIVIPSGSCADMIVHHYAELPLDDDHRKMAQRVAARTHELTSYLVDERGTTDLGAACGGCTGAYHPSCHGLRNLGLREQPQALLAQVEGLDMVALPDAEDCCGFGGLFSVEMPEVSAEILAAKLDRIEACGADILVGTDVSCLMHIAGGLHRRGSNVSVKHIAEVLSAEPPP
jgi:L-lactate dehydrogenase complex protein LldE